MKNEIKSLLIISVSAIVLAGGAVGIYYGTKPADSTSDNSSNSSTTDDNYTLNEDVKEMFAADNPVASAEFTDYTATNYINAAYAVILEDDTINAFYYDLTSDTGYSGKLEFAIGIKNNTVAYYTFITNISEDEEVGVPQVSETTELFVGYTLGGDDVRAGVTAEYTYPAMKKAVDAALTDCQNRVASDIIESSSSSDGSSISTEVSEMFAADNPQAEETLTASDTTYINVVKKVTLEDTSIAAYYYDLTSGTGYSGKVEFAIGVKNNTVAYYTFITNISEDEEVGVPQVSETTELFVGYTLGGDDVRAGVTAEYTYPAMKKAVDAALTDAQGR